MTRETLSPVMKSPLKKRFALDISRFKLRLSRHAERMANEKKFSMEDIEHTFYNPTRVYPSGSHPGQWRITGNGLCLVGIPDEEPKKESKLNVSLSSRGTPIQTPVTTTQPNALNRPVPSYMKYTGYGNNYVTQRNECNTSIQSKNTEPETQTRYFTVITIYQDQVLTPPRPDQLDTPEGKRYAERYLKGLGRG